jgi:hypothetical protein
MEIAVGLSLFVAYELYRQEALSTFPVDDSYRPIPQWIERCDHAGFYWWHVAFHAAPAAFMWWRCLHPVIH